MLEDCQLADAAGQHRRRTGPQVSTDWAEYMDGNAIIPPNILATNSITGDHWSSRWWANRAAGGFWDARLVVHGGLARAAAVHALDPHRPADPARRDVLRHAFSGSCWCGTAQSWVPLAQGPAKAATSSSCTTLATAGQTVFPLTASDLFGKTFSFNQTTTEGLQAYVNGVRLVPVSDYTVNTVSSVVTLARPVSLNAVATFDILDQRDAACPHRQRQHAAG